MIKIPMEYRVFKKLFLFFLLLLTFQFSLLTSSAYAGYPSLMKNGFIEEVGSGDDNNKASHADHTQTQKDNEGKALDSSPENYDKKGMISFGLEAGYGQSMGFVKYDAPIFGVNFGFWVKKKIQVGLGF
jgi:hypothetical protein